MLKCTKMKTDEWKKVKAMLPYCERCPFKEIKLDTKRNYTTHRFCNAAGGKNLIDVAECPQKKF